MAGGAPRSSPRPTLAADDMQRLRAALAEDARLSLVTTAAEIAAARDGAGFTLLSFGTVLLHPLSAYMFLEAAIRTEAAIVYSDHDRLQEDGSRADPAFKPQFSPEYLARYNYIGDCLLLSPRRPAYPRGRGHAQCGARRCVGGAHPRGL